MNRLKKFKYLVDLTFIMFSLAVPFHLVGLIWNIYGLFAFTSPSMIFFAGCGIVVGAVILPVMSLFTYQRYTLLKRVRDENWGYASA